MPAPWTWAIFHFFAIVYLQGASSPGARNAIFRQSRSDKRLMEIGRMQSVQTLTKRQGPLQALGWLLAEALIVGAFCALLLAAAVMGVVLAA